MRITPTEIAVTLIAADLATLVLVLRGRHRKPRRSTLQRTLDAYHAYERDVAMLTRDEPPEPVGWGFARKPCGCTEFFEQGSQVVYCNAHAVDAEIGTWRI